MRAALADRRKMPSVSKQSGVDRKSVQANMIGGISWLLPLCSRIHSRLAPNCNKNLSLCWQKDLLWSYLLQLQES